MLLPIITKILYFVRLNSLSIRAISIGLTYILMSALSYRALLLNAKSKEWDTFCCTHHVTCVCIDVKNAQGSDQQYSESVSRGGALA